MTTTQSAGVTPPAVRHPLEPATAGEYDAGRQVLAAAGLLGEHVRFAYYGLDEADKDAVLAHVDGAPVARALRAFLIDVETGEQSDVVVSLTDGAVLSRRVLDPLVDGQLPIIDQDFADTEAIVRAHPGWLAAMERRGLRDVSTLRVCALTAGSYGFADEVGRRMVRALTFVQQDEGDLAWAHPVDGVTAYVDLLAHEVVRVVDDLELAVPATSGNYDDPAVSGPARSDLRPIEITQPEGPSFTLDGHHLRWLNWDLRVGFDAREGLTLHQIAFAGRPIVYRASVPEMVVPYGDPGATRFFQNYFDNGEYLVGKFANSLELGCDCLGEIRYLDATITGDRGEPRTVRNAICIHEEDFGILWKHTDMFNGSSQTRRQRRLVVSFFATVANYDYGYYWYFYLDGTIELEVKLTGIVWTSSYRGPDWPYATEIAPGLGAPAHQHLFGARLDMMVDGLHNAVDEVDIEAAPVNAENPYGNGLRRQITRLGNEADSGRRAAPDRARTWRVVNEQQHNGLGQPVGYTLYPQPNPTLLADPSSSLYSRAGFATQHLWVTRYDGAERYPAGDVVNQHPGGAGVPAYAAAGRNIDGADIVLWHTFGPTHFPRPEDWPVMPVDRCGFVLKPTGFFDRNPTLDIPPSMSDHCHRQDG